VITRRKSLDFPYEPPPCHGSAYAGLVWDLWVVVVAPLKVILKTSTCILVVFVQSENYAYYSLEKSDVSRDLACHAPPRRLCKMPSQMRWEKWELILKIQMRYNSVSFFPYMLTQDCNPRLLIFTDFLFSRIPEFFIRSIILMLII
jgi:hypothetical protein